jgi:hypothetical protein
MTIPRTIGYTVDLRRRDGRKKLCAVSTRRERVPRIARWMALAIRFERLIRDDVIPDNAALARLGHVSRARITQIMNLLFLAPDIQEQILFLPPVRHGRDPIHLAQLQPLAREWDWRTQRALWAALRTTWPGRSDKTEQSS